MTLSPDSPIKLFSASDRVGEHAKALFNEDSFQHTLVSPVLHFPAGAAPPSREQAQLQIAAILDHIASDTPRDYFHLNETIGSSVRDNKAWRIDLGGKNHFFGAYSIERVGAPCDYAVVVHNAAGHVGKELGAFAEQNPNMTIGDFIETPQYKEARAYSRRNASQLGALIGLALSSHLSPDVEVFSMRQDDKCARPPLDIDGSVESPSLIEQPMADTETNFLERLNGGVLHYDRSTAVSSSVKRIAQPIDPLFGVIVRKAPSFSANSVIAESIGVSLRNAKPEESVHYARLRSQKQLRSHIGSIFMNHEKQPASSRAPQFWRYNSARDPIAAQREGDLLLKPFVVVMNTEASSASRTQDD